MLQNMLIKASISPNDLDDPLGLCLEQGAHLNNFAAGGRLALQTALVRLRHRTALSILAKEGADATLVDNSCGTALQAAAYGLAVTSDCPLFSSLPSYRSLFATFLNKPLNLDCSSGAYGSALEILASRGLNLEIEMLVAKGADVSVQSHGTDGTALHAAAFGTHPDTFHLLQKLGAELSLVDHFGFDLAHWSKHDAFILQPELDWLREVLAGDLRLHKGQSDAATRHRHIRGLAKELRLTRTMTRYLEGRTRGGTA